MKIPRQPPPDFWTIIDDKEKFETLIKAQVGDLSHGDEYLHWDKLRHLNPPKGLSKEQWWYALKMKRFSQQRRLDLSGSGDQRFTCFPTDKVLTALHKIDLSAGGVVGMPEQVTNSDTRDYYYVSSLMEEAVTSSQLEGAATTREVAREMIRSGRPPRDRSEKMILNNYVTMRQLAEWKDQPLSQDLVFEIHRLITEETLDNPDAAGRFRRSNERVEVIDERDQEVLHCPPPAGELLERMEAMCRFANAEDPGKSFLHPVLRAIILHFVLAFDHPFVDGNGRTARALFYWLMLRNGYWLFEFISISQILVKAPATYARSFLYTETDEFDLNYFIDYQIEVIQRAIRNLHDYIERKSKEIRETITLLRGFAELNHRQQAVLNRALRHPNSEFTVSSHRKSHNTAYDTARNDLISLEQLGLLEKRKRGRALVFKPVADLNRTLKSSA